MMYPENLRWKKHKKPVQPVRLNIELIVRKSVSDAVREYLDQCGIAGIKEIREPNVNIRQRLVYIAIFMASCLALGYVLYWTTAQALTHPLVVTQESTTYPIQDIDFPAVALCNVNRISNKSLHQYARIVFENITSYGLQHGDMSFEDILEYIWQYGKLVDFSFTEDMKKYPNEDKKYVSPAQTHRVVAMMERLAPSCEEMLLKCAWAGELVECSDIFTVRRTIRGHCCVFNYVLSYHSAGRPNRTSIASIKRQIEMGHVHGLHVVLDPLIEDYAYPVRVSEGFDVFLFDPLQYMDPTGGRVIHRFIGANEVSHLEIQSVKQLASPEVKLYPKKTRKCLFHDEFPKEFGDMYSYSTCIVSCRIKTVSTLCKCTPYFAPISLQDGAVCTLERLRCLNKYKEKLLYLYPYDAESFDGLEMESEDALSCEECLPDCEFTQHFSKAFKLPLTLSQATHSRFERKAHQSSIALDFNLTNKCQLSIYQSTGDGTLNRLDVISNWFEILSNVGGYAGILLGFSIISVMEAIYFIIFVFPHILYNNYIKYY